jgi:hypothetical protein
MSHILAETLIVIVAITYSALAVPLIVWALKPQLGAAMIKRIQEENWHA